MRPNSARVRLWLWRICAAKLVLPFGLLFALGGWLGFPVYHSADRMPAPLLRAIDAFTPWLTPAQSTHIGTGLALLCLLMLLPAAALSALLMWRALRIE